MDLLAASTVFSYMSGEHGIIYFTVRNCLFSLVSLLSNELLEHIVFVLPAFSCVLFIAHSVFYGSFLHYKM